MKKMIALLLTALMGLSLTACGGDGGSKDTGLPGVDMKSTEVQAVTSDRGGADRDVRHLSGRPELLHH